MSFLGNLAGPKESEIIERLGPGYFGITWSQLEDEISNNRDSERREEIVPIRIDAVGEPYVLFSSPDDEKGQRFYLRKEGYTLYGKVLCVTGQGERVYLDFE